MKAQHPLVHIGMPKCASTWLQRHFFTRAHGFRRIYGPLEANLAFCAPPPFDRQQPPGLSPPVPPGMTPLITGESLAGSPLTGGANSDLVLQRLARWVPDARILIVIREQRSMLRSLYQLLVNWGNPRVIEELLTTERRSPPGFNLEFLEYHRIVGAYQAAFGTGNVLVLPYEKLTQQPHEFLSTITDFCRIDSSEFPLPDTYAVRENPGRSLASLFIKRLHNRFLARTALNPNGIYRPSQIQSAANFDIAVPQPVNQWLERQFSQRVERKIGHHYASSNATTEALTGLELGCLDYCLPSAQSPLDMSTTLG